MNPKCSEYPVIVFYSQNPQTKTPPPPPPLPPPPPPRVIVNVLKIVKNIVRFDPLLDQRVSVLVYLMKILD